MKTFLNVYSLNMLFILFSFILIITYLQQEYIVIPHLSNMPMVDETLKAKIFEGYYKHRWLMYLIPLAILLIRVSLVIPRQFFY